MISHDEHMRRCLWLAEKGRGWVQPNPMVGCVIVRDGKKVGEAYHHRFGGLHAEVLALRVAGKKARGATLYVNLEPCSHFGKTPPCVDAIIAAGIKRVVASSADPNRLVSGRGFQKLKKAGIIVETGVMRDSAARLNEKFFHFMKTGHPFVAVKLAQTIDGKIADALGRSRWITSKAARMHGHFLRSTYDAVLVGAGTVETDDPLLSVRFVRGRNPKRVILDGRFAISMKRKVIRGHDAETIILTSARSMTRQRKKAAQLERRGVQVVGVESAERLNPSDILKVLTGLNISSVLIEGGSDTVRSFLERRLVQRVHCFVAPTILGSGKSGFRLKDVPLNKAVRLRRPLYWMFGDDMMIEGDLVYENTRRNSSSDFFK